MKKLRPKHATVILTNEKERKVKDISINPDSIAWIDRETKEYQQIQINQVNQIILKNRIRGAFQGFLWGLAGGIIVGLLSSPKDTDTGYEGFVTGINIAVCGSIGIRAGLITGTITGTNDRYYFNPYNFNEYDEETPLIVILDDSTKISGKIINKCKNKLYVNSELYLYKIDIKRIATIKDAQADVTDIYLNRYYKYIVNSSKKIKIIK